MTVTRRSGIAWVVTDTAATTIHAGERCRPAADLQDDIRVEQIPKGTEVMCRERGENLADHGKRLLGFAHGTSSVAAAER